MRLLFLIALFAFVFCKDSPENVVKSLTKTGFVAKAAVTSLDGSVKAKSDNFKLTKDEAVAAVKGFYNKGLLNEGLTFEGVNHHIIRFSKEAIAGEKDNNRFTIVKTTSAVVIAICSAGKFNQCLEETTKIAKTL